MKIWCEYCDKEVSVRDTGCRLVCEECGNWIRGRK